MTINNLVSRWNSSALSYDIPAGFAVFLVSLPLSLGIALASGAYLFSGLIAGIIGGLIVVPLSGSRLGISGATAGLSVLVLTAINELGFNEFLMAVILAGILQIGLGCLRAGVIAYYFPSAVINGVLTGMGIILILKQIPHALGYDKDYEGDFAFLQSDDYSSFSELLHMVNFISPGALIIAVLSLTVLLLWERPTIKRSTLFRWLPSPVVATLTGVLLNHLYMVYLPGLALSANHFVTIPETSSIQELIKHLHSPAYQAWQHPGVYTTAVTLALVASLESLLAVEAIDKLDPYRNKTSVNRELLAQGVGNIMSGLLGGLPLTMVVVRSSFNIQAGAKTKLSAFVQGLLLLLTCLLVPHWLNEIPLASLAAILLVVAYRLARPVVFKTMYKAGYYHFVPFCLTIVGLVLTDLLTGIIIGLVIALIAILLENYKAAFYFRELHIGNKIILRLAEHVSFLNKANIQKTLEQLPEKSEVVIDATRAKYIDYDVYEMINEFSNEAKLKNIALTIKNLRGYGSLPPLSNARPPTFDTQQALTPSAVLTILKEGNEHFVNNLQANRNLLEQINDTRQGQFPIAIILSCMDSRTSVELIFDQGLGDVFSVRIAGNIVNDDILGSMEYACKVAGSRLIVVLGHTHCGAIKGACAEVKMDHLTGLLEKIKPAVDNVTRCCQHELDENEKVLRVAEENVALTVNAIPQQSAILRAMISSGEIGIVGAMYDIETGRVRFFSEV